MKLTNYLNELVAHFNDSRPVGNTETLTQKIIEQQTTRLWTMADDKAEYEKMHNLLSGKLKSVLNDEKVSQALRQRSTAALGDKERLLLFHDPSDIRKPHAEKMTNLGTVRDLDGRLVSGYSTFNTVAVTPAGTDLRLVDTSVYSNGDPHFVSQAELKAFRSGKMAHADDDATRERAQQIDRYLEEDSHVNQVRVTQDQLRRVHDAFKADAPDITLCHVLDRQFDGEPTFDFIDQALEDEFVIRLKISRNAPEPDEDADTSSETGHKLKDMPLPHRHRRVLDKIVVKKRVYQQAQCVLEWGEVTIAGGTYAVVRVMLRDRHGTPLYKHPMLLLTNIDVVNESVAQAVYTTYLMRAKIEAVFKFLKDTLGWEEFQVRDFESIKNIIALCFFVGGYFYEIESALAENPVIALIAQLGGGKGKVTRHFFLEGLKVLLIHQMVEQFLETQQVDEEGYQAMLDFVR